MAITTLNNRAINRSDTASANQLWTATSAVASDFQAAAAGGKIVQVVNVQNSALASGTTIMPHDDSIPQITEGDEYMTLAITPTSASNKLFIEVVWFGTPGGNVFLVAGLFQDTTAGALAAASSHNTDLTSVLNFNHYMAAGTTSATTFRLRVGPHGSATAVFNGRDGARLLGGVSASSITITEIEV